MESTFGRYLWRGTRQRWCLEVAGEGVPVPGAGEAAENIEILLLVPLTVPLSDPR